MNFDVLHLRVGCVLLVICALLVGVMEGKPRRRGMSYEDMVTKEVMDSYKHRTVHSRPVKHFNDTLNVKFAIQLMQIMSLSEKNQVLELNIWDQVMWYDAQFTWDPKEYGNVTDVRVPCDKIWTPDLKLYNYADERLEEHREALCLFHSDGKIFHMPQVVYKSSCQIDVYYFPFDVQNCTLWFASWTFEGKELNLDFYEGKNFIDMVEYKTSAAWLILDCPGYRYEKRYTCCPGLFYPSLEYQLVFQRRSALYNLILILPCVLLTSITLILFFIPPESPAKMMLGLAIFIAFFVLLRLLEKNLPPGTRHMPLLGTYYCLNMILITLSSFLNLLIVDLNTHGLRATAPPTIGPFLFKYVAKWLWLDDLVTNFKPKKVAPPKEGDLGQLEENKFKNEAKVSNEALAQLQQVEQVEPRPSPFTDIDEKLVELREFMKQHQTRLKNADSKAGIAAQWKAMALILDRIFFAFYFVIIFTSLCYTLPVLTMAGHEKSCKMN